MKLEAHINRLGTTMNHLPTKFPPCARTQRYDWGKTLSMQQSADRDKLSEPDLR